MNKIRAEKGNNTVCDPPYTSFDIDVIIGLFKKNV